MANVGILTNYKSCWLSQQQSSTHVNAMSAEEIKMQTQLARKAAKEEARTAIEGAQGTDAKFFGAVFEAVTDEACIGKGEASIRLCNIYEAYSQFDYQRLLGMLNRLGFETAVIYASRTSFSFENMYLTVSWERSEL